ncbi:hypothetical protein WJX72_008696 [[Myrmecia] bisecta]|uniref:EF-hand domain-containing protein n=1 Tax=[Myrmecia] bisecta TaxID=41462 RepID=A0AAW1R8G3_9CHLO
MSALVCSTRRRGTMGLFNWMMNWMGRRVFRRVDVNQDGRLEGMEVEVAILRLYNTVNKRLPSWQDPPTREQIRTAFAVFDVDRNGTLDEAEFIEFAKQMLHSGPDQFFARMGREALVKTAIVPGAAHLVQRACSLHPTLGPLANAPLAIFAPIFGVVVGSIKGLLPY